MSRPKAVSKKEFLEAYAKNKSVIDLAIALNVCEMTVRNYLTKFGLSVTSTVEKRDRTAKIYQAYRNDVSLTDLVKKFGLDIVAVRYQLRKGMVDLYSGKDKPKWPRPYLLSHIKIVHALGENPGLKRRPEKLAAKVKLSDECIDMYLRRLKIKGKVK